MNYSITIDHKLRIIKYVHQGSIKAEEIGAAWQEFLGMKEFTELKYDLFSDYRNAKFNIKPDFLPHLIEFMYNIKNIVNGKKQCLIVDEPYSTAASLLFENEVNTKVGFKVRVFSTEEAALSWLLHS